MSEILCRDIFNGVYINVRSAYIDALYSVKTKSKVSSKSVSSLENLISNRLDNDQGDKDVRQGEDETLLNETVSERLEREEESEVASKIRSDIEEKFPFAMAFVCSDLSTVDKAYRRWKGLEEQPEFSEIALETTDPFPLSQRFALPCVMFISSMVLASACSTCA